MIHDGQGGGNDTEQSDAGEHESERDDASLGGRGERSP